MTDSVYCGPCDRNHARGQCTPAAPRSIPRFEGLRADEPGPAKKMDLGKPPIVQGFHCYFPLAITAVAYVSEYGDRKYAQPGKPHYSTAWQQVDNGEARYADADGRHRLKISFEGPYDYESQLAHLAHKAWNAMAELELALRNGVVEMRVGNQIVDGAPVPGTFKTVLL